QYDVKDLNLSSDGNLLLFSARRAGTTWNLYEYDFRNQQVRAVLPAALAESGHDSAASYTSDGRIVFVSDRGLTTTTALFSINRNGTDLQQLTDGMHHDSQPVSLLDGGLVFLRRSACATAAADCQLLQLLQRDSEGNSRRSEEHTSELQSRENLV